MTRREAIAIGLGLPLLASEASEFWNHKKPEDWSDAERKQLLTRSPWARPAEAKFNGGPGSLSDPWGSMITPDGAVVPGVSSGKNAPKLGGSEALVRWESALPIREAERNRSKDDGGYYILSVTGDLPMARSGGDQTEDERESRLENLKQYTRLEKRGGPIYLSKIGDQPGQGTESGTRFFFERDDPITLHDGSVTFVAKLGPIEVKCRFALKEMAYRGKLEL